LQRLTIWAEPILTETIAEAAHLPLYYVGAGELERNLMDTERKLQRVLDLARAWRAIVLIDEADVFLTKRNLDDVERNGLVSVFLRVLEYHEGVIFLTTNRINAFDAAFMSRIHLRIKYPALDAPTRAKIWQTALQTAAAGGADLDQLDDGACEALAEKYELNGREITNLARTAHSIARSQGRTLSLELVEKLYQLSMYDTDPATD